MNWEYLAIRRDGKKTSGHEQEELHEVLNHYGSRGWQLKFWHHHTDVHQTLVFEREKRGEDRPATGP